MLTGLAALQGIPGATRLAESQSALSVGETAGTGFSEAMNATAMRTVAALENAEALSFQGMTGGAETREVVDAVMSAEQSLQAAIAIRDKIVQAYLEISRMQI